MTQPHQCSTVVADDHPLVLRGLVELLECEPDISVVASCSDGAAALKAILELKPDVAVLDISMPGLTGLEVLGNLALQGCGTKVILLTASVVEIHILTAIAQGAKGLIMKDMALNVLVQCIREVASGQRWFSADLVDAALLHETGHRALSERLDQVLTSREREVMLLVSEGLANKEVGRRLGLSEGTVKIHIHNIFQKLKVPNRTALTALALARRE
jgi:two-component system, NarL family, nitrate/nitrite response regulator NarL